MAGEVADGVAAATRAVLDFLPPPKLIPIWTTRRSRPPGRELGTHDGQVQAVAVGPDGSWVVTGVFVQTLAFGMMGAALGTAGDMQNGLMDRFRVLPMARGAVLVGRTLADLATAVVALVVMTGAGLSGSTALSPAANR